MTHCHATAELSLSNVKGEERDRLDINTNLRMDRLESNSI
jgi:hypothetical protein